LTVPDRTPLAEKCLAEVALPEEFLVIHVQRYGETILPHGDTCLQPNDIVTFLIKEADVARLEAFWRTIHEAEVKTDNH
jgi:Trk K+ transport system NAD-binding subunit